MTESFDQASGDRLCELAALPMEPPPREGHGRSWRDWEGRPERSGSAELDFYLDQLTPGRPPKRDAYLALLRNLATSFEASLANDVSAFGWGPRLSSARLNSERSQKLVELAGGLDVLSQAWRATGSTILELHSLGIPSESSDAETANDMDPVDAVMSLATTLYDWAASTAARPPSLVAISEFDLVPDWSSISTELDRVAKKVKSQAKRLKERPTGRDSVYRLQHHHLIKSAQLFARTPAAGEEDAGWRLLDTWRIVFPKLQNLYKLVGEIPWGELGLSSIKPARKDLRERR